MAPGYHSVGSSHEARDMDAETRVLVTGAGAPGFRGTMYSLVHNPDNKEVHIIGTDIAEHVSGRHIADAFYVVPPPESPDYVERMLVICLTEHVDVVLPQTTRELSALSSSIEEFVNSGVSVAVAPYESLLLANSKLEILETFKALGFPYPHFRVAESEGDLVAYAEELGYPDCRVAVKPPVSSGMRGFRILTEERWNAERFLNEKPSNTEITLKELCAILEGADPWPRLLVTEYLPGPEYSVDAFIGIKERVAVPRLRKAIRSGITFESRVEIREDLANYTLGAGQRLGLRYAFGFQYKLDEKGTPKVLECNPRVQGTMVASTLAGTNVIWMAVREALGNPVSPVSRPVDGAEFYRYWGGVGVTNDSIQDI